MVRRTLSLMMTMFVMVVASIVWAVAAPSSALAAPSRAPGGNCTVDEWQQNIKSCVDRLADVTGDRAECLKPPTPSTPDSGLGGWFAERPASSTQNGPQGMYSKFGYAGYSYSTYDLDGGCTSTISDPETKFENTVANGEFMIATSIIGASNALRERAWDPKTLWGWADPLVEQATKAVYDKVFRAFGAITVAVVGIYLIWRSRQADMGSATTTAGWAALVMVAVTAIAAWPVRSATIADQSLITTLSVVHGAVGPRAQDTPPERCDDKTPGACTDNRPPAVRASDIATESMLYRNWLRGLLGSADSQTAQKYGQALYEAKSLTWRDVGRIRTNPTDRAATISDKNEQWMKVAEQIKTEDPEAYEYLKGTNGMDRIGSGFIAMLAALMFAMFDLTASLLVLLGFLIFRWAVIAAPILGTIGILQPASSGLRRLGNAVIAAVFNIVIFGTGAAIYLFAVDLIMNTSGLAGWLQVVLVFLCGLVGWLLLRPYRRITQLSGKDGARDIASGGSWQRRFFRDMREASKVENADADSRDPVVGKTTRTVFVDQSNSRPEARREDWSQASADRDERDLVTASGRPETASRQTRPDGRESGNYDDPATEQSDTSTGGEREPATARRGRSGGGPRRSTTTTWAEPDVGEQPASYAIYRPETGATSDEPVTPRVRSEAR